MKVLKAQKWIPVEERLPEPEQDVIISVKTGIVTTGIYTERYGAKADRGFICSNRFMMVSEVGAWMPLPEVYESERYTVELSESATESVAAPLLREKVNSPLSPFVYKDELQKEIYKAVSINHMMYGA